MNIIHTIKLSRQVKFKKTSCEKLNINLRTLSTRKLTTGNRYFSCDTNCYLCVVIMIENNRNNYLTLHIESVGLLHPTGISSRYNDTYIGDNNITNNYQGNSISSIISRKEYQRILYEVHNNIILHWPCYYISWIYCSFYPIIMMIYICFPSSCMTDRYYNVDDAYDADADANG